jgi:glycosyltransferase involved in cell wall biosynthesis
MTSHVAFVSPYAQLGGSERYLSSLLQELGDDWIEEVVTLQDGPFVAELEAVAHRPPRVIPTGPGPASMVRSARVLRRDVFTRSSRIAVIHANGLKAALVCVIATLGRKTPVVWVKHDFSWDGWIANVVARRCKTVVGVSAAVVASLPHTARVEVVRTGLPPIELDRAAARRDVETAMTLRAGDDLVVLTGRMHRAKGQLELVEALPRILESRPALRVIFVGADDPTATAYADRVRARVVELALGDAVSFAGYRTDAQRFIAAADVVVIPSVRDERGMGREGFSLVAVEAMSAGTPVVAYEDGALGEVLGDCAELVAPGDRAALADAIAGLLRDHERREELAACGRRRARDHFDVGAMVGAMKGVYERADRA